MTGAAATVAPGLRREEADVPPPLRGIVSRLLRSGLLIAGALFLVATIAYVHDGVGVTTSGSSPSLSTGLWPGLSEGDPGSIVLLGLLVLLITPLTRVAVSVLLYASVGDRAFTALTLFVFLLLVATLLVGAFR